MASKSRAEAVKNIGKKAAGKVREGIQDVDLDCECNEPVTADERDCVCDVEGSILNREIEGKADITMRKK